MKLSNAAGGFTKQVSVFENHFQQWSHIVYVFTSHVVDCRDTQNSRLRFDGKAILHSKGVDFSSGKSFSLRLSDLLLQEELGKGNYGTVIHVTHKITNTNMAMKQIQLELDPKKFIAIITELQVQKHSCYSVNDIRFYMKPEQALSSTSTAPFSQSPVFSFAWNMSTH